MRAVMSSSFATAACTTPAKKIHTVEDKSQTEFVVTMDTCFHWTLHLVSMATACTRCLYSRCLWYSGCDVYTPQLIIISRSVQKVIEVLPYFSVLKEVSGD